MRITKLLLCGAALLAVVVSGIVVGCSEEPENTKNDIIVSDPDDDIGGDTGSDPDGDAGGDPDDGDIDGDINNDVVYTLSIDDSLTLAKIRDSLRVEDSLRNIHIRDSLATVDSIKNAVILDSLLKADSVAYLRFVDSMKIVRAIRADSIRIVDSIQRVTDSVQRVADSILVVEDSIRVAKHVADSLAREDSIRIVKELDDSTRLARLEWEKDSTSKRSKKITDSIANETINKRIQDSINREADKWADVERRKATIPNQVRAVIGHAYNLFDLYALDLTRYDAVLDLDKLLYDTLLNNDGIDINRRDVTLITGSTVETYQRELSQSISVSAKASGGLGTFSGSFAGQVKTAFGESRSSSNAYAFATYRYYRHLKGYTIPNDLDMSRYITENFKNNIQSMTGTQLVDKYGTHVVMGAVFGGRVDYNMSIAKRTMESDISSSIKTHIEAKAKFSLVSGETDIQTSQDTKIRESFVENSEHVTLNVHGGNARINTLRHEGPVSALGINLLDDWGESVNANTMVFCDFYQRGLVPLSDFVPANKKAEVDVAIDTVLKKAGVGSVNETLAPYTYTNNLLAREGNGILLNNSDNDMGSAQSSKTFIWTLSIDSVVLTGRTNDWFTGADIYMRYVIDENEADKRSIFGKSDMMSISFGADKKVVAVAPGYQSETIQGDYPQYFGWVQVIGTGCESVAAGTLCVKDNLNKPVRMIQKARVKNNKYRSGIGYHIEDVRIEFIVREPVKEAVKKESLSKRRRR